jgi:hypothetical protein
MTILQIVKVNKILLKYLGILSLTILMIFSALKIYNTNLLNRDISKIEKADDINIITSGKAFDIVANLPELKEWQLLVSKSKVSSTHITMEDVEHIDPNNTYWEIHVFEEFPDHRATFNWYKVDKTTGAVTPRIGEEINDYYRVYQNPNVIYLRKALNAYLANDSEGSGIMEAAATKNNIDGIVSGLDSFSKDYYKSKFIVFTIDEQGLGGGTNLQIIFQDKPDKIFYAWVYQLDDPDKTYNLRGFSARSDITPEAMKDLVEGYKEQIQDKEHSI